MCEFSEEDKQAVRMLDLEGSLWLALEKLWAARRTIQAVLQTDQCTTCTLIEIDDIVRSPTHDGDAVKVLDYMNDPKPEIPKRIQELYTLLRQDCPEVEEQCEDY